MTQATIVVHGGCGSAPASDAKAEARLDALRDAIAAGLVVLDGGGSALDAVCAAVVVLEDAPVFNAGRGAVPTSTGAHELDASVMDGRDRRAGAVAAITLARNPIMAARAVLDGGVDVLLAGDGADAFAARAGLPLAPPGWFTPDEPDLSLGTVGAVALDADGHVAAATSTGGRRGQLHGRVGDSPVIGAGTWADDRTCAVSGTGHGEAFLRTVFAHSIHAGVAAGRSLDDATVAALTDVSALGSTGGCIAITPTGDIVMRYTTDAMSRGWASVGGAVTVDVW